MRVLTFAVVFALLLVAASRGARADDISITGFHQVTDMATCAAAQGRSPTGALTQNSTAICSSNSASGLIFFGWQCIACATSYDFAQNWAFQLTGRYGQGGTSDVQEFNQGPSYWGWSVKPNQFRSTDCIVVVLFGFGAGAGVGPSWSSNAICGVRWVALGKRQSMAINGSAYSPGAGPNNLGHAPLATPSPNTGANYGHKGFALTTPSPTPNATLHRFTNAAALAPIPPPAPSQVTALSSAADVAQCVRRTQLGSQSCNGALSNHWVILVWNSACGDCSYQIYAKTANGDADTGYNPTVTYAVIAPPYNTAGCYKVQATSKSSGATSIRAASC